MEQLYWYGFTLAPGVLLYCSAERVEHLEQPVHIFVLKWVYTVGANQSAKDYAIFELWKLWITLS